MRAHVPRDGALDRADVGDDGARLEERRDLLGDRSAGADGDAEDHEVGALDRFRVGFQHAIDHAQFFHPRAGLGRARCRDDLAGETLRASGAGDRAADQAEADQRDAFEERFSAHLMLTCPP